MNSLIISGSKMDFVDTGITGVYGVTAHCSLCGEELTNEIWIDSPHSPTRLMSRPKKYVRIIFGVHLKIHSQHQGPVPAIFTPAYFCKECENYHHIVYSLLKEFLPDIHPLLPSDNQFNPALGCWITIWPLDEQSQPTWPLDYQISLPFFQALTKSLKIFLGNPFNVF